MQSLHDGVDWVHSPLRLSVFIEAPREAIDRVLATHPHVAKLVDNEWIFLHQLDERERAIYARHRGGWKRLQPRSRPARTARDVDSSQARP